MQLAGVDARALLSAIRMQGPLSERPATTSELDPAGQSLLTRVQCRSHLTRCRIGIGTGRVERVSRAISVELRVIENVVSLPTNSQADSLFNEHRFVQRHVEVHPTRLAENTQAGISPRAHR